MVLIVVSVLSFILLVEYQNRDYHRIDRAIDRRDEEQINKSLKVGVSSIARDKNQLLKKAIAANYSFAVRALLTNKDVQKGLDDKECLLMAIELGFVDIVRDILTIQSSRCHDINYDAWEKILVFEKISAAMVKTIYEGVKNSQGVSRDRLLYLAAKLSELKVFQYFLENLEIDESVSINQQCNSLLKAVSKNEKPGMKECVLNYLARKVEKKQLLLEVIKVHSAALLKCLLTNESFRACLFENNCQLLKDYVHDCYISKRESCAYLFETANAQYYDAYDDYHNDRSFGDDDCGRSSPDVPDFSSIEKFANRFKPEIKAVIDACLIYPLVVVSVLADSDVYLQNRKRMSGELEEIIKLTLEKKELMDLQPEQTWEIFGSQYVINVLKDERYLARFVKEKILKHPLLREMRARLKTILLCFNRFKNENKNATGDIKIIPPLPLELWIKICKIGLRLEEISPPVPAIIDTFLMNESESVSQTSKALKLKMTEGF